ncbi:hypothetical protein F2Q68_00011169 [Brassica cretica]|uniref:Uncharacterized protein n=1 Tax=Brassica cretica TaxID=69181 RepID=A0A8S9L4M8_BRACR|nr:hypothetical protein F2Q68_00011169 [Brassica cretica]
MASFLCKDHKLQQTPCNIPATRETASEALPEPNPAAAPSPAKPAASRPRSPSRRNRAPSRRLLDSISRSDCSPNLDPDLLLQKAKVGPRGSGSRCPYGASVFSSLSFMTPFFQPFLLKFLFDISVLLSLVLSYDSQGQEGTIPQNSSNTLSFASPSCPPNGVPLEDPHSPLHHFTCTELRTVMMNISVYGEMAFYVMPDEFFRTRVLGFSLTKEI